MGLVGCFDCFLFFWGLSECVWPSRRQDPEDDPEDRRPITPSIRPMAAHSEDERGICLSVRAEVIRSFFFSSFFLFCTVNMWSHGHGRYHLSHLEMQKGNVCDACKAGNNQSNNKNKKAHRIHLDRKAAGWIHTFFSRSFDHTFYPFTFCFLFLQDSHSFDSYRRQTNHPGVWWERRPL